MLVSALGLGHRYFVRKIRCHYASPDAFRAALEGEHTLRVFTTSAFEPGEELLLELSFQGLPGRMMVRAIGREWHAARPRLRIRAGGVALASGTEWEKLVFLRKVASGEVELTARRRHLRLPLLVEVQWRKGGDRSSRLAALSEISEGGALLLTQEALEIGEEVIVEIVPPGSARALEITAHVRNAAHEEGVGLEFVARDMGGVHRLREVIRRLVEQ